MSWAVMLVSGVRVRGVWRGFGALCAPATVRVAWWIRSGPQQSMARAPWNWELSPARLRQLFDFLLSADHNTYAFCFALVLVGIVFLTGAAVSRERCRCLPAIGAAAGFFFVPAAALGQRSP